MTQRLTLSLLDGDYSVLRYHRSQSSKVALPNAGFASLTISDDETSLVCRTELVAANPAPQHHEQGWRLFRFEGPFEFTLTGVLSSVTEPLARAEVGIFAISSYDTDYLMVKAEQVEHAISVLSDAGHRVIRDPLSETSNEAGASR